MPVAPRWTVSATFDGGPVGVPYSGGSVSASGGTGTYKFSVSGLPPGVRFAYGSFRGTPTTVGDYRDVTATDTSKPTGSTGSASADFEVEAGQPTMALKLSMAKIGPMRNETLTAILHGIAKASPIQGPSPSPPTAVPSPVPCPSRRATGPRARSRSPASAVPGPMPSPSTTPAMWTTRGLGRRSGVRLQVDGWTGVRTWASVAAIRSPRAGAPPVIGHSGNSLPTCHRGSATRDTLLGRLESAPGSLGSVIRGAEAVRWSFGT